MYIRGKFKWYFNVKYEMYIDNVLYIWIALWYITQLHQVFFLMKLLVFVSWNCIYGHDWVRWWILVL